VFNGPRLDEHRSFDEIVASASKGFKTKTALCEILWVSAARVETGGETMLSTARYGEDRFAEVEGYRIHYVDVGAEIP